MVSWMNEDLVSRAWELGLDFEGKESQFRKLWFKLAVKGRRAGSSNRKKMRRRNAIGRKELRDILGKASGSRLPAPGSSRLRQGRAPSGG